MSADPFAQLDSKPVTQVNGSYNPFDMPTSQPQLQPQPQPAPSLEASFQHLQVTQPLFPHSTGGYPGHQSSHHQSLYQQPLTPPVTSTVSQTTFATSPQAFDGRQNPFFQSGIQTQATFTSAPLVQSPGVAQTNPFFSQFGAPAMSTQPQVQQTPGSAFPNPLRHANTMPTMSSTPFGQVPPYQQQYPQSQPQVELQPFQQGQGAQNPFQNMMAQATPQNGAYQAQYQPQLQPGQHLVPQPTGRVDKGSILSLYNLSPAPGSGMSQPAQLQASSGTSLQPPAQIQQMPTINAPQLNAPQSIADLHAGGSRNPFMAAQAPVTGIGMAPAAAQLNGTFPRTHMSQQSVDINGFQNGRHSPDAFANLSARYG